MRIVSNFRLTRPMGSKMSRPWAQAQQTTTKVPVGFILGATGAKYPLVQHFQGGCAEYFILRGRFVVGKPFPKPSNEANDLLPGLVAHSLHDVNAADGELQQVAHGEDFGSLQGVDGTGAEAQGGNRRLEIGLLQRDGQIDFLTAGSLDLPLFGLIEDLSPCPKHLLGIVVALAGFTMQSRQEELDQSFPHARVKLFGVKDEFSIREGRIGLAVAPLRQRSLAQCHLVESDTHGVAFRRQVPPLRFAVDEKRVGVASRAYPDVVQWGTGKREIEQDQLVPLFGQRTDADVVGLDVPMGYPSAFKMGHRRQQVVAVPGQHLQAGHAIGAKLGGERLVAGLLQDEDRPAVHDQFFLDGDDELAVQGPQGLGLFMEPSVVVLVEGHLEDDLLFVLGHQ